MKEITHPIMKIEFYFHRNCYKEPVIASPEEGRGNLPAKCRAERHPERDCFVGLTPSSQ